VEGAAGLLAILDVAFDAGVDAMEAENLVHEGGLVQTGLQEIEAIVGKKGRVEPGAVRGGRIGRLQVDHVPLLVPGEAPGEGPQVGAVDADGGHVEA
jgi:hypothetical protein